MGSRIVSASSVHRARGRRSSRADSVAIYCEPISPLGSLEHDDRHRLRWQTWRFAGPGPPEASSVRSSWMTNDRHAGGPRSAWASLVLQSPRVDFDTEANHGPWTMRLVRGAVGKSNSPVLYSGLGVSPRITLRLIGGAEYSP